MSNQTNGSHNSYMLASGVHKTGIRGIQDTRQIVDGRRKYIENNDKKGGSKPLT